MFVGGRFLRTTDEILYSLQRELSLRRESATGFIVTVMRPRTGARQKSCHETRQNPDMIQIYFTRN